MPGGKINSSARYMTLFPVPDLHLGVYGDWFSAYNKDNTHRWERERRYGLDPNHWLLNKTVFQTVLSKLKVCKQYVRHFISGSIYKINTEVQQRELSALCKITLKQHVWLLKKAVQVIPLGCAPAHIQYYNAEVVYHADANLSIKNMSNCIKNI